MLGFPIMPNCFNNSLVMWIRQDWLDKVDMEIPTTLDELHDVLVAFVNEDPDGNGIKDTYGDVQINVHCHSTSGVTLVSLMKAIEAGADVVDTSISSLSLGPGHNPTESLVEMLEGTPYKADLDMERLIRIRDHFAKIRPKYAAFESATLVDTDIFLSQIPGGMLSNMESQLKAQGAGDRVKEVMEQVPLVKAAAGHPPLVTPSSQIVGTQAVFNVLMGEYKVLTGEFADLMLGYYGETIGERDPEVIAIAQAQAKKEPISRPERAFDLD